MNFKNDLCRRLGGGTEIGMYEERKPTLWRTQRGKLPRGALLLGGILLGVILLLWGNPSPAGEAETQEISVSEMEAYVLSLEEKICLFCEQVAGVGEASVTVSLESGWRRVLGDENGSYLSVGSGFSRNTVCLSEEPPVIGGIAVVCTGGGDPAVRQRLVGLLCAAYNIGSNKIYIAQAQN